LSFGELGAPDRLVPLARHVVDAASCRLRAVVRMSRRGAGLGQLAAQCRSVRRRGRGLVAVRLEALGELVDAGLRLDQLGPGADRNLLSGLPPTLGAAQRGLRSRLLLGFLGRRDQLGDAGVPPVLATQPLDADRVDELGERAGRQAGAELAVGLDGSAQLAERAARDARLLQERLQRARERERRAKSLAGVGDGNRELDGRA
jgi:hypothetical protein